MHSGTGAETVTNSTDHGPVHAELRRIGDALKDRLRQAQRFRQLPRSPLRNKKRQVVYDLFMHMDRSAGEIRANVRVTGLGWAIPDAADPAKAAEWMETGGEDLVARIDRILGRDDFGVTGYTRLDLPVLELEEAT